MAIRYGRKIPNDEAGPRFRDRVLDTYALCGSEGRRRADNFLALRCSWMTPDERAAAVGEAFHSQRYWSAEALGNDLDVTEAERKRARIRTFRAAGMSDEAMEVLSRANDRDRKRRERAEARLHPEPKVSVVARRLEAILRILPSNWVSIKTAGAEAKRKSPTHFAGKTGKHLAAAVHDAVKLGLAQGQLEKRVIPGPRFQVAKIRRSNP
ncbi:hypothetical protein QA640_17680 [Bradyrhizobium sp. CB82]|uniref:hypothetical protein n=1 Tax=Bradyrhizobium sp. CB82 TaxID=3039159 RepID=UPI0024B10049|nr:hypothetical protein [Bradyrhizobium sp. CB82]WFU44115.1 hypothetical protein QA640_17680 [Bradyrhizobium sp. CB82]